MCFLVMIMALFFVSLVAFLGRACEISHAQLLPRSAASDRVLALCCTLAMVGGRDRVAQYER